MNSFDGTSHNIPSVRYSMRGVLFGRTIKYVVFFYVYLRESHFDAIESLFANIEIKCRYFPIMLIKTKGSRLSYGKKC